MPGRTMNFLFVMDPLSTVKIEKDTSFIFMIGAERRGHDVWYVANDGIHLTDDGVSFDAVPVTPQMDPEQPFVCGERQPLSQNVVDAVFIRTDPPFDHRYLMNTWLLDHLPPDVVVINDPDGIRTTNEKIWALQFHDLIPPTLVTAGEDRFTSFLAEHRKVVAKPTDGFGGQGVFIVEDGDTNAGVIFETLSDHGQRAIIIQRYIPEATIGDKRILLLDGEPLGAVLRVHGDSDHRNNFFAGGQPVATEINKRDREIIAALQPHLRRLGLMFVGIDVIGDRLIEVNVTSPTCLQEMNRLYDVQLEDRVITFVEDLVQTRKREPNVA
jgi:glutathione synthase